MHSELILWLEVLARQLSWLPGEERFLAWSPNRPAFAALAQAALRLHGEASAQCDERIANVLSESKALGVLPAMP